MGQPLVYAKDLNVRTIERNKATEKFGISMSIVDPTKNITKETNCLLLLLGKETSSEQTILPSEEANPQCRL